MSNIRKYYGSITVLSFWVVIGFHFLQIWETWRTGDNVFNPAFAFLLWATSMSFYAWGLAKGDLYMAVSRVPSTITAALSFLQFFSPSFNLRELTGVLLFCSLLFVVLFFTGRGRSERNRKLMFYTGRAFFALGYSVGLILQTRTFLAHGAEGATFEYWLALLISSLMWTIYGLMNRDRWQAFIFGLGTILCIPIVVEILKL